VRQGGIWDGGITKKRYDLLFLGHREHNALSAGVHHDEAVRQDGVALLFTGNAGHGFPGADEPTLKVFGWLAERGHRSTGAEPTVSKIIGSSGG
jgi:hypothetical protein